ncbi:MAG: class I SAM-dependent methyltransferase [Planctomycetota bacterium]
MSTSTTNSRSLHQVLEEVYREKTVEHPNGEKIKVVANINERNARALFRFVSQTKPALAVEIGMAYGVSTLTTLSAIDANGNGRLISIDPYIGWPTGRLVAFNKIKRAGLGPFHQQFHECSYTGLPRLIDSGEKAQFIYIDGHHNYDYVFTDFFLADKLLDVGGVMAFNDAGWKSVFRVINFLRKYRHYEELDVGLPKSYRSRNLLFSLIKRIQGRSSQDRYFRKLDTWEPEKID